MNHDTTSILIITGEASGDFLAERFIRLFQARHPDTRFTAVAGPLVAATGATILLDHTVLNVMGILEVIRHLKTIAKALHTIKLFLQEQRPDLVILVDFAGFNLKVAKIAKSLGIPVLFYVSPKIWAWNKKRIYKIKKYVDHMAVLFPFEVEIYEKAGIPVTFVGHPLVDVVFPNNEGKSPERTRAGCEHEQYDLTTKWKVPERQRGRIDPKSAQQALIALLPGSRRQEIHALMPTLIESAKRIKAAIPHARFTLPIAPGLSEKDFAQYDLHSISLTQQTVREVLQNTDAAIVCSGTATLETALAEVPMVIVYKLNRITYWIGRMLLRIPYIGLCNIVAEELVAPELIQEAANPENISRIILDYLQNPEIYEKTRKKLKTVRAKLGGQHASEKMVELVEKFAQSSM